VVSVRRIARTVLVVLVAGVLGACGSDDTDDAAEGVETPGTGGVSGSVRVFAAASLTDTFAAIEAAFEDAEPGVDVELNFAGSSTLREQILGGAPADVFASADEPDMDRVVAAGAVAGQPEVFARNRMEIAVPVENPGGVNGLADLAEPDLLVGLCAVGVPCGDLARRVFAAAGIDPAVDTEEPDVRALLTKVAAGELDAGLVYVTDVLAAAGQVEGIDVPAGADIDTAYPIAVLDEAPNAAGAQAFVDFVLSDAVRRILDDDGFAPA
jgi:molybdate transport system substrate-binding protein